MASYSISEILNSIDSRRVFLPCIQRKYVWKEEQILKLMDSLMRGYPIGTFLIWNVKKKTVNENNYAMYDFIKDYDERNGINPKASEPFEILRDNPDDSINAVLDGQQRLTALYIAFKGSMKLKEKYKQSTKEESYIKKELFINLKNNNQSDKDVKYEFAFLSDSEATNSTDDKLWYRVKDIIKYNDLSELSELFVKYDQVSIRILSRLFTVYKDKELIVCYLINNRESMDEVLDIFVRVNSGGMVLSKTDLLFSTIVSYWNNGRDLIDEFIKNINRIGDHYKFDNDFIMRACLYVCDLPIVLKVDSFRESNIKQIQTSWDTIKTAIEDTVNLLNEFGFNSENIISYNAILPIIYYRYRFGEKSFIEDIDKEELRKYFVVAQLKSIFGQSSNSTLEAIRKELKKRFEANPNEKFKLSFLQELKFSGDKNLKCDSNTINTWFDEYEKGTYTFMLLSLLYPNLKYSQNGFHQDHMHPYASFNSKDIKSLVLPNGTTIDDERIKKWKKLRNTLANLQLLEGKDNKVKNKTPLSEWLKEPKNFENTKYLPKDIDYSLANFDLFIEERKKLMIAELSKILL